MGFAHGGRSPPYATIKSDAKSSLILKATQDKTYKLVARRHFLLFWQLAMNHLSDTARAIHPASMSPTARWTISTDPKAS